MTIAKSQYVDWYNLQTIQQVDRYSQSFYFLQSQLPSHPNGPLEHLHAVYTVQNGLFILCFIFKLLFLGLQLLLNLEDGIHRFLAENHKQMKANDYMPISSLFVTHDQKMC